MFKKNNIPTTIVLLGATGDLVARKILPALFRLYTGGHLPDKFRVIGFSRRELTDQKFRDLVQAALAAHASEKPNAETERSFLEMFYYSQGEFETQERYTMLAKRLSTLDDEWGLCANKLFYFAVPPSLYETIFRAIAGSGLTLPCSIEEGWTRVIVEKPFGSDLNSAKALDELLGKLFKEEQIYRIDHYLAKEMIQNILSFRFSNNLFEGIWDHSAVERVEVKLFEKLGAENRGTFYDSVGALRDVGQNHLLQMLALATMDRPQNFSAEAIREKRLSVLAALTPIHRNDIKDQTYRAQYKGYHDTKGVNAASVTETYFKVRTTLDLPRWNRVPMVIEGGKQMHESIKEIRIIFAHPSPCFCLGDTGAHHQNEIIIRLEPNEEIEVYFWAKKPGLAVENEKRSFHFELRGEGTEAPVGEYDKLLLDCISGDQTLFVSTDEIRAMWRFIDPIVAAWKKDSSPIETYTAGSDEISRRSSFVDQFITHQHTQDMKKHIAIIGLGKMGGSLARQLMEKGWKVTGFNRSSETTKALEQEGMHGAYSFQEVVDALPTPKIIWLMLPAGDTVDTALFAKGGFASLLSKGDIVIDGGNSFYKDTIRRAKKLKSKGIIYMDAGTSGGPSGARNGASLMVGGDEKAFKKLEQLFKDISIKDGYQHLGEAGAGHFVKMVHNGIEYGMMQAIAEGFAVMKKSPMKLDLLRVTDIYNHGSVIESRLIGWLRSAYQKYGQTLKGISGSVAHTGEGAWTVKTAKEFKVPAPVIDDSLKYRIRSLKKPDYAGQVLSALRNQFGGHAIEGANEKQRAKKK